MPFYIFLLLLSTSLLSGCAATEEVKKDAPTQTSTDTNAIPKEWVASTYVERIFGQDMSVYHAQRTEEKETIKDEPYEKASQAINDETKKLWEAVQKSTISFNEVRHVFESLKDFKEDKDKKKPQFDELINSATEKKQQVTILLTEAEEKWNTIKETAEIEKRKINGFETFYEGIQERKTKAETLNETITQEITNLEEKIKYFNTDLATCHQEENNHKKVSEEVTEIVRKSIEASSQMPSVTEEEKKRQEAYEKLNEETVKGIQKIENLISEMDELIKKDKTEATKKASQPIINSQIPQEKAVKDHTKEDKPQKPKETTETVNEKVTDPKESAHSQKPTQQIPISVENRTVAEVKPLKSEGTEDKKEQNIKTKIDKTEEKKEEKVKKEVKLTERTKEPKEVVTTPPKENIEQKENVETVNKTKHETKKEKKIVEVIPSEPQREQSTNQTVLSTMEKKEKDVKSAQNVSAIPKNEQIKNTKSVPNESENAKLEKNNNSNEERTKLPSDNIKSNSDSSHINTCSLFFFFLNLFLVAIMRA